jgi:hypothetical protein
MLGALAGCSRTVVQGALRMARRLGVLIVKERRIPGRKSLTNVVTVAAKDWLAWLRLGGAAIGLGNSSATNNHCYSKGAKGRKTDRCDTKHGLHEHATQAPGSSDRGRGLEIPQRADRRA